MPWSVLVVREAICFVVKDVDVNVAEEEGTLVKATSPVEIVIVIITQGLTILGDGTDSSLPDPTIL